MRNGGATGRETKEERKGGETVKKLKAKGTGAKNFTNFESRVEATSKKTKVYVNTNCKMNNVNKKKI